jgi:hypothetical protein
MRLIPRTIIWRTELGLQLRTKIVLAATAWWLLLALLSRLDLSPLQQVWNLEGTLAILLYMPACIMAGGWIAVAFSLRIQLNERGDLTSFPVTEKMFVAFMLIFVVQCLIFVPPVLSASPNDARLEWGFPFVHVLTEIIIRVMCLLVVGNACARGFLHPVDRWVLISGIIYTIVVVSRSFMLEIFFYWGFASIMCSSGQQGYYKRIFKSFFLVALVIGAFIGYGNWRQGAEFDIVDYGEMEVESNVLAWMFGYFLVNFDNLALLISAQYKNEAFSNTFGSILQTLQIAKFDQVNDYLYVGKFNLGTAFRPFVLDYGVWFGGVIFVLLWAMVLLSPSWCKKSAARYALHALIAYSAFCLPITSRIQDPPYLFALIWILVADRINIFYRTSTGRHQLIKAMGDKNYDKY